MALAVAFWALVTAQRARNQAEAVQQWAEELDGWLRVRLRKLEQRISAAVPPADVPPATAPQAVTPPAAEPTKGGTPPATTAAAVELPAAPPQGPRQAEPVRPAPAHAAPPMSTGGEATADRSPAAGHAERPAIDRVELRGAASATEPGLEESLGARLPVWLGAIALALAGAFLVQYGIEQGWLSPTVRLILALGLGVALLAGGEWLRPRADRIAVALSGAGVAVVYAALFAGIRLYELIPPLVGFGLLAANTAVAVGLSLRQGPLPAVLGLVGGFLTPWIVRGGPESVPGLFGYLLLLDVGLLALARRKSWPALSLAALAASFGWLFAVALGPGGEGASRWLALFALVFAATFALPAGGSGRERDGVEEAEGDGGDLDRWLRLGAPIGSLLLSSHLLRVSGFDWLEWALFGLLGAGCLVLAFRREATDFALAPVAAVATVALLRRSTFAVEMEQAGLFAAVFVGALGLWSAVPYWLQFRSARPAWWALLSAGSWLALGLVVVDYLDWATDLWSSLLCLGLAGVAAAAAVPLADRRSPEQGGNLPLGAAAVVATLFASLAVAYAFDREWLTVALALEVPALWAIAGRLRLRALRELGMAFAAIVAVRLLLNPAVLSYPIGTTRIWNLLLWGYGVPAAGLWIAARLARRQAAAAHAIALEAGSVALAFVGVTFETLHALHPTGLARALGEGGLVASSALVAVWLLFGIGALELDRRVETPVLPFAGRAALALGGFAALFFHLLERNPAFRAVPVGELPVWNLLLAAYALPALLLWLASRPLAARGDRFDALAMRIGTLVFAFVWITLEVRHAFRGADLASGQASGAERFAYSATWAVLATLLLVGGVVRGVRGLRLAALAIMLLVVLKVFLFDASGLAGLYRVLSFLGLGASLLLLAWLYQRYVFRREGEA
ncbi:MAG: DUF2339 domain-containing protein [Holophagales bacterium]|nr:DUF2339 domain-containing protein [Holophagales bacterium]